MIARVMWNQAEGVYVVLVRAQSGKWYRVIGNPSRRQAAALARHLYPGVQIEYVGV